MKKAILCTALIAWTSVRSAMADTKAFTLAATFMAINNLAWFGVWWVFFSVNTTLRGWELSDVCLFSGIGMFAFGLAFIVSGGALDLSQKVRDGYLDVYLTQPRSPLIMMILNRADPEGLGDIISGLILIGVFGGLSPLETMGFCAIGVVSAIIILGVAVAIHSSVFWIQSQGRLMDQLFESFIHLMSLPTHGLPKWFKVMLMVVLPAGFIAVFPVEMMRDFSWWKLGAMIAAAIATTTVAATIFRRGLRRYTSGNQAVGVR